MAAHPWLLVQDLGDCPLVSLFEHAALTSLSIVAVLLVATKTSLKSHARIHGYHSLRVRETTVASHTVRVAAGTITLVVHRSGKFIH